MTTVQDQAVREYPLYGFKTFSQMPDGGKRAGETIIGIIMNAIDPCRVIDWGCSSWDLRISTIRPTNNIDLWIQPYLIVDDSFQQEQADKLVSTINAILVSATVLWPSIDHTEFEEITAEAAKRQQEAYEYRNEHNKDGTQ